MANTDKVVVAWDASEVLKQADLDCLIIEKAECARQKKEAEERIKEIDAKLGELFTVAGVDGVTCDGINGELWKAQVIAGKSADQISKTKLLSLGVSVEIIQQASTPGKEYTYVRLDDLNKNKGGNGKGEES